ncbi:hypothetical protein ACFSCZ_10310 [Siminovitchia sediminis]|uniref:Integral membrane protein n=1 Tax=Siminovitchia sediminis TaxID=1274353 RepID=A0ABW4KIF6_9BACI
MSGFLFIFVMWGIWIISFFLLDKNNPFRYPAAILSLMAVILHSVSFTLFGFHFSAASILLLLSAYRFIVHESWFRKAYLLLCVLIITFGYAGFYLIELYDPVWVLIDRKVLLAAALIVTGWILLPGCLTCRYAAIVIGSLQGEVFLAIFLSKWKIPYIIGSMEYLDVYAVIVSALVLTFMGERLLWSMKLLIDMKTKEKKTMLHD